MILEEDSLSSQIITSAHYMLSDLFVPANTDPTAPGLEEESSEDSNDLEDEMDNLEEAFESLSNSVPIQALCSSASLTGLCSYLICIRGVFKVQKPPHFGTNKLFLNLCCIQEFLIKDYQVGFVKW